MLFATMVACSQVERPIADVYTVRDYKTVKLYLDTFNAKIQSEYDSIGSFKMSYAEFHNGKKHLIFFGATHSRDLHHPQFRQLAALFKAFQPEVAFNEGGEIPRDRRYSSMDSAIISNGETGVLKLLCDSARIRMKDGDMNEREEMMALKKAIPRDQLYLYMAIERFLNGYHKGHFPGMTLEAGWHSKFIPYMRRSGLGLTLQQESLDTLKAIYKRYLHQNFVLDSLVQVHEFYLTDDGVLGDVGRATKIVRDQALLAKIDSALYQYDRVFVVFGSSHLFAVTPALKQIIQRKRE
ncbi:MAG: hypothetical protein WKF87_18110 [Chryseolinea sp.]